MPDTPLELPARHGPIMDGRADDADLRDLIEDTTREMHEAVTRRDMQRATQLDDARSKLNACRHGNGPVVGDELMYDTRHGIAGEPGEPASPGQHHDDLTAQIHEAFHAGDKTKAAALFVERNALSAGPDTDEKDEK